MRLLKKMRQIWVYTDKSIVFLEVLTFLAGIVFCSVLYLLAAVYIQQ